MGGARLGLGAVLCGVWLACATACGAPAKAPRAGGPAGEERPAAAVERRPAPSARPARWTQVVAGARHSCALRRDGAVWCWGENAHGQTRGRPGEPTATPVRVRGVGAAERLFALPQGTCARLAGGSLACWGDQAQRPHELALRGSEATMASGAGTACVTTTDGAWCASAATPSHGTPRRRDWRPAEALDGADAPVASRLRCGRWGEQVRCAQGETLVTVASGVRRTGRGGRLCVLDAQGRARCLRLVEDGPLSERCRDGCRPEVLVPVAGSSDVLDVDGDLERTCTLHRDGAIRCLRWERRTTERPVGGAVHGAVEQVLLDERPGEPELLARAPGAVELAVGGEHLCVRTGEGVVRCLGRASEGQVGDGRWLAQRWKAPHTVEGVRGASDVAVAASHSCALVEGAVQCWGDNRFGQLGVAEPALRPAPAAVPGIEGAAQIAVAARFACALGDDGTVRCWGGEARAAAQGTWRPGSSRGATALRGDAERICARMRSGRVRCWTPQHRQRPETIGGVPPGAPFTVTAAGPCALRAGRVVCGTGKRRHQIAEAAGRIDRLSGRCGLREGQGVRCWYERPNAPVPAFEGWASQLVKGTAEAVALSARGMEGCAVLEGGAVACWRAGDGPNAPAITAARRVDGIEDAARVAHGDDHSCVVTEAARVRCFGAWRRGQIGVTPPPAEVGELVRVSLP